MKQMDCVFEFPPFDTVSNNQLQFGIQLAQPPFHSSTSITAVFLCVYSEMYADVGSKWPALGRAFFKRRE